MFPRNGPSGDQMGGLLGEITDQSIAIGNPDPVTLRAENRVDFYDGNMEIGGATSRCEMTPSKLNSNPQTREWSPGHLYNRAGISIAKSERSKIITSVC